MQINKNVDLAQYLIYKSNKSFFRPLNFENLTKEGLSVILFLMFLIILTPFVSFINWNPLTYALTTFFIFISFLTGRAIGNEINMSFFEKKYLSNFKYNDTAIFNAARRVVDRELSNEHDMDYLFKEFLNQEMKELI